jgi:alkylation response protein AidB-like acyl-CoA dehydrogenase
VSPTQPSGLDRVERTDLYDASVAVVSRHLPLERTRVREARDPLDRQAWAALCQELEPAAMRLPARWGGQDLSLAHLTIVATAAGALLAPTPLLATAGVVVPLIAELGTDAQRSRWLPGLLDGSVVAAFDLAAPADRPGSRVEVAGADAVQVSGRVRASGGADADVLLILHDGQPLLVDLDHADAVRLDVVDATRPRAEVRLDAAPGEVLGRGERGRAAEPQEAADVVRRTLDEAAVLAAGEAVGAARAFLATTVTYVGMRSQFGRPVGSFQAVAHRTADLLGEVESATAAVEWAARIAGDPAAGSDERARAASVAIVRAAEAEAAVARQGLHLHGGIGFTAEHPSHLYLKRSLDDRHLLGGREFHLDRLAALVSA